MQVSKDNPRILVGASIPRSGHHFLADMMTAYYGPDIYYCEYYTLPSCCRAVPCTRRGAHRVIYQKSHDRDFKLPADVSDALYLIQYRHPVPEALSDRELDLQDGFGRPSLAYRSTLFGYQNWLAGKAIYYRRFHDKWIAPKFSNAVYLDYADLAADPKRHLKTIVERTTGAADGARLDAAIEKSRSPKSSSSFKPRVISESPYFDAALLGALESWILERCPLYGFSPELNGSYADSPVYGLILLKDASEPLPKGEKKRFMVAAELAPEHPEVKRRFAVKAMREGRTADGMNRFEQLILGNPYFSGGYKALFAACAEAGTPVPDFALTGNALVACAESAELSAELGDLFAQRKLLMNAVMAYGQALTLDPQNADVAEKRKAAIREIK
ncbi:MAG TPA: hypothetical protein VMF58_15630 [Rhizomicrobium sp.]|nr:hypothetical protein [Rhizomicrobium sp.]